MPPTSPARPVAPAKRLLRRASLGCLLGAILSLAPLVPGLQGTYWVPGLEFVATGTFLGCSWLCWLASKRKR